MNVVALPQTDVALTAEMRQSAGTVGTTALVYAIINAHFDLAAMLVEKGADPNIEDTSGMAALYAAVEMEHASVGAEPAGAHLPRHARWRRAW